jgi:hypothetical protein
LLAEILFEDDGDRRHSHDVEKRVQPLFDSVALCVQSVQPYNHDRFYKMAGKSLPCHVHPLLYAPDQKLEQSDASFIVFDKPPEAEGDFALELAIVHWDKGTHRGKHALQKVLIGFRETKGAREPFHTAAQAGGAAHLPVCHARLCTFFAHLQRCALAT